MTPKPSLEAWAEEFGVCRVAVGVALVLALSCGHFSGRPLLSGRPSSLGAPPERDKKLVEVLLSPLRSSSRAAVNPLTAPRPRL